MKSIRITQIKSGIDRNETAKRTLVALGLKKMHASVEVEATPQILGMVKRAGHLIKVEEVETPAVAEGSATDISSTTENPDVADTSSVETPDEAETSAVA